MGTTTTDTTGFTLTKMTQFGRVAVKVVVISLVALMVGRVAVTAAYNYYIAMNPEPPPPPTRGFGILPALQFPEQLASEKPTSYILETPTGGFADFGDRAKVFLMTYPEPSLLADEQAKRTAARLGFTGEPEVISSSYYRWTRLQPLFATLDLDINTLHFTITTDYLSRPELLYSSQLPTNFDAVQSAKGFINSAGLLPADTATSSGSVKMLKASGTEFVKAVSLSDADLLQVDLYRTPIDEQYEIFTPDDTGTIHAVVGNGGLNNSILKYTFAHHTIDYSQFHTYPLRTPESAWNVLKSGEGYVAVNGDSGQAVIRRVILGYYDSPDPQPYFQPIYVFLGDDGFIGYVSALDPQSVQAPAR